MENIKQMILFVSLIISGFVSFFIGYKNMKKLTKEESEIHEPNKYDSIDPTSEIEEMWNSVDIVQNSRLFVLAVGLILCGMCGIIQLIKRY